MITLVLRVVRTGSVVEATAAGALATEAAFMENIGLYLNPISKPLLNALQPAIPNKIGSELPPSGQADPAATVQDPSGLAQGATHLDHPASKTPFTAWEDELLLEWSSAGPAGPATTSTQDQVSPIKHFFVF